VLPTLRFSREFGLIFLWSCGFFQGLRVACFGACFNWNLLVFWACFLQNSVFLIAFSSNFVAIFCFNLLLKAYWACFYEILVILGLFFRICHYAFLFNLLADISLCCIFLPTHVGFVFPSNYLFLACFSYLLACFCKITWHHCAELRKFGLFLLQFHLLQFHLFCYNFIQGCLMAALKGKAVVKTELQ